MALRWVPVKTDTAPTTANTVGDEQKAAKEPVATVEVGSADVEFALGQPSPKPAPSSPQDEDFMDAQDMEESKDAKDTKRPRVLPGAGRSGPVVNYTPGHPPSWHFKQLFGKSEIKDEEEVSGVFPALTPVGAGGFGAPADPSLKSRQTPPTRPAQNSPPVALAYSSSPLASRRIARERRKSTSGNDSLAAAVKKFEGSRAKSSKSSFSSSSSSSTAPASTVSSSKPSTTGPSSDDQARASPAAAAASSAAPWFSSSSGRPNASGAAAAATGGTTSGQPQQAGSPNTTTDSDVFHSTGSAPSTETFATAFGVTAAAAAIERKEQQASRWRKDASTPERQQQQQQAAERPEDPSANGQQPTPTALKTSADAAAAAAPASQASPAPERTMSLKAAAILGVTVPDDASKDTTAVSARALSQTGSEGGGGSSSVRSSTPKRGSFSKAFSASLFRSKKGKIPASPHHGSNVRLL